MNYSLKEKNSILIVDDDKLSGIALKHILGDEYDIHIVRNGQEAITTVFNQPPDIILLDIIMPGLNGFQVIELLKSTEETRRIPVVFITGLTSVDDEEKGLDLGAADFIKKPYVPALVKLRVKNQLQIVNQLRLIDQLSLTDPLTELPNRRQFNQRLENEWLRSLRDKTPIGMLIIDIDNFKGYNDSYGHLQGDIALKSIGNILRKRLYRQTDLIARWGGEEFAVILPNTNKIGTYAVAENMRCDVESAVFPFDDAITKLTISIGINCIIPIQSDDKSIFIRNADRSLYTAKSAGRNKVIVYEEDKNWG